MLKLIFSVFQLNDRFGRAITVTVSFIWTACNDGPRIVFRSKRCTRKMTLVVITIIEVNTFQSKWRWSNGAVPNAVLITLPMKWVPSKFWYIPENFKLNWLKTGFIITIRFHKATCVSARKNWIRQIILGSFHIRVAKFVENHWSHHARIVACCFVILDPVRRAHKSLALRAIAKSLLFERFGVHKTLGNAEIR